MVELEHTHINQIITIHNFYYKQNMYMDMISKINLMRKQN